MEADRLGGCKRIVLILDTNMAIYMAQGLFSADSILDALGFPYLILVTPPVLEELRRIASSGRPSEARRASRALEVLEREGYIEAGEAGERADDSIVSLAVKLKSSGCRVVVATSDRELRRRLRSLGVPTLYYRESRGSVEVEWEPI